MSLFASGGADACALSGYSDPATGLCGPPKSNGPCYPCNGSDPINHNSGTSFLRETDYRGTGNLPLMFERFYASRDLANTPLGVMWRQTYSSSLMLFSDGINGTVNAWRDDGRMLTFTFTNGVVTTDPDVVERMSYNSTSGNFILINANDRTETYDPDGRLISVADHAGETITLTYSAGHLSSAKDAFGRVLSFGYDSSGRLSSITTPNSEITSYGYDSASRLYTVTRPDKTVRQYLYNETAQTGGANLPNTLTGIVDETNTRYLTWTYDAQGRATSSHQGVAAATQLVTIAYSANGTATVTDARGTARTFTSTVLFGVAHLTALSQICSSCGGTGAQSLGYDANGNVASRIDFNNNRTNYTYDLTRDLETQRVEGLTSAGAATPHTRTITTQWHPTWRLPQIVAEPKRITTYIYNGDTDGGAVVTCGATGALCRLRISATTDLTGASGLTATLTGTPRVWNYTYNSKGQRLTEVGPRTDLTQTTTWAYNATTGNLSQITNAVGQVWQYTQFDGNGRPLSMTDPNAVVSTLTYDYHGYLASRAAGGATFSWTYTPVGQLKQATAGDGSYQAYTYDDAHRLTQVADNLLDRHNLSPDNAGEITGEQWLNPDGTVEKSMTRVPDSLGRGPAQEIGAAQETTVYGYDNNGNLTSIQDPRSTTANPIVTNQIFDELNRLAKITDANTPAGITTFTYDGRDQITQLATPNGATTSYTVDGLANVTQEVSPDRGTLNYTPDAAGNITGRQDARGITASYTDDALNRPTSVTYPTTGENVTLTYDQISATDTSCTNGAGRLCKVVDAGGTTLLAYDVRGNLTQTRLTELGFTYTTTYYYDLANHLASIVTPTSKSFAYGRDAVGRVNTITGTVAGQNTTLLTIASYSALSQVAQQTLGTASQETIHFDGDGRASTSSNTTTSQASEADIPLPPWALFALGSALMVVLLVMARPDERNRLLSSLLLGTVVLTLICQPRTAWAFDTNRTYDAAGNLKSRTNATGTTTYSYDNLSRVISETGPGANQSFTYDGNGNRTSDGTGGYAVGTNTNRYTSLRGVIPQYDASGSLQSGLSTGSPPTAKTFGYNQAGQVSTVSQGATLLATYTYDWRGLRTQKALTAAGAQTLGLPAVSITIVYHYDAWNRLIGETTPTGAPIRTYIWRDSPNGDVPVAQIDHPTNTSYGGSNATAQEAIVYFDTDDLGTPRAAYNAAGQTVWLWAPDAFGSSAPNETVLAGTKSHANLRFPGQYYDTESGLHYNQQRIYDATSGRYVQSDPIGLRGGINTYAYVRGNPLSLTDPSGTQGVLVIPEVITIGVIGCAITPGCLPWINDNILNPNSESRGKNDPITLPDVNPGRDCNGNCNPCPEGAQWWVDRPGHGHANGYWHKIVYNQDPETCMCYADRPSSGLEGN